uniref:Uncharacterized protein n=1 Tax=Anguilla anguilla TaxID=7936 RepID=A0A0E9QDL8_ANGAN
MFIMYIYFRYTIRADFNQAIQSTQSRAIHSTAWTAPVS